MSELPPECGFCTRTLDEGERLTPVYIGDSPDPRSITTRAVTEKQRKVVGRRVDSEDLEVLDRPLDEISALLKAINRSDRFTLETKRAAAEMYAVGESDPAQLIENTDYDKIGVTLRADPEPSRRDPDLRVCEYCSGGLADE